MTYGRQEPGEPYKRISVHEALEMQKAGALVVDVRRDDEWEGGHPVDAIHVEVDNMQAEAEERLPKGRDLLFICAAGVRSGLAAEMAAALGFELSSLYNVEQGVPVWMEQDLPTAFGA
jgi:rhodanese-related sulfurtransferase